MVLHNNDIYFILIMAMVIYIFWRNYSYERPFLVILYSRPLTNVNLFCHHNSAFTFSLVLFGIYKNLFKTARRFKLIYTLDVAGLLLLITIT
jgi:hypothetical protein